VHAHRSGPALKGFSAYWHKAYGFRFEGYEIALSRRSHIFDALRFSVAAPSDPRATPEDLLIYLKAKDLW